MNVIQRKFLADLAKVAEETKTRNTPAPGALSQVEQVFGTADSSLVWFAHRGGETFEVTVDGFELKRGCTLVVARAEELEFELYGPVYQVRVFKKIAGIPVRKKTIESSADMVPFCTSVPGDDFDN